MGCQILAGSVMMLTDQQQNIPKITDLSQGRQSSKPLLPCRALLVQAKKMICISSRSVYVRTTVPIRMYSSQHICRQCQSHCIIQLAHVSWRLCLGTCSLLYVFTSLCPPTALFISNSHRHGASHFVHFCWKWAFVGKLGQPSSHQTDKPS